MKVAPGRLRRLLAGLGTLRPEEAERAATALRRPADEGAFVGALARWVGAGTLGRASQALAHLVVLLRTRAEKRGEGAAFRLRSSWQPAAVAELARKPGFQADPAWISAALCGDLSEAEAASALADLVATGWRPGDAAPRWTLGPDSDVLDVARIDRTLVEADAHLQAGIDTKATLNDHWAMPVTAIPGIQGPLAALPDEIQALIDAIPRDPSRPVRYRAVVVSWQSHPVTKEFGGAAARPKKTG